MIVVETQQQRCALIYAKQVAGKQKNANIGYPDRSLSQSVQRYNYIMRKFNLTKADLGVTGHGLRHQYANERYEKLSGLQSPVRGGNKPSEIDRDADIDARYQVSEELGHSRLSVTAAYYGINAKPSSKNMDTLNDHASDSVKLN